MSSAVFESFGQGRIRSLPRHQNPGLEVVYVVRGNLNWEVEGRVEAVAPGSVFYTLPWQRHGSVDEFEPGHHWYYVVFDAGKRSAHPRRRMSFSPGLHLTRNEESRINRILRTSRRHSFKASQLLAVAMTELLAELGSNAQAESDRAIFLARTVLLELVHLVSTPGRPGHQRIHDTHQRLIHFQSELARRCNEPWTLEHMAAACKLGRTRFADLIRQQTGDSPIQLLNRLRVDRARHLLRTADSSITRIAQECGFTTSQYFAEVFASITGETASAYRKRIECKAH